MFFNARNSHLYTKCLIPDAVKLDLDALERDFGFAPGHSRGRGLGWLVARLFRR